MFKIQNYLLLSAGLFLCAIAANAACTVSSTILDFGTYTPLTGTSSSPTGTITVQCAGLLGLLTNYTISLDKGIHSTSYTNRKLSNGSQTLNYNIFTTGGHSTVWGDGTSSTATVSGTCLITILNIPCNSPQTMFGFLAGSQTNASPGSYTDTITVTVNY